jgi:DNA-binding transcriptional ArsR family regulator
MSPSPRRTRRLDLRRAAPLFAALGDETRLDIVGRLCAGGPLSIARLSAGARVTRQAVTKHLSVLAAAGLARGTRSGRDHVWRIDTSRLDDARRWLDHIGSQWDEALERMKFSLEGSGDRES